jgi:hypothetical protein
MDHAHAERTMKCAANNCCHKSLKKHKWTGAYTKGIPSIRYWHLQRRLIENTNLNNATLQTLQFYAGKYGLHIINTLQYTVGSCLHGIKSARSRIKQEIILQSKAKEQYQYNLVSDTIDRKSPYLAKYDSLSDKFLRDDLIDRKLKHMSEVVAHRNLFTMIRLDIT